MKKYFLSTLFLTGLFVTKPIKTGTEELIISSLVSHTMAYATIYGAIGVLYGYFTDGDNAKDRVDSQDSITEYITQVTVKSLIPSKERISRKKEDRYKIISKKTFNTNNFELLQDQVIAHLNLYTQTTYSFELENSVKFTFFDKKQNQKIEKQIKLKSIKSKYVPRKNHLTYITKQLKKRFIIPKNGFLNRHKIIKFGLLGALAGVSTIGIPLLVFVPFALLM